ncbi:hypothetical protein NRK67_02525 [Fusobacteria bacterium ZRK30]|nr:hypothetical protein NRK67_02525 [Fusobacteria bacterium ZRK30]
MNTSDIKLFEVAIRAMERVVNEILYYEREEFLYEQREVYIENRGNGFNDRDFKLSNSMVLSIKVPKVRKNSRDLIYSIFEKYKRNSNEFEINLETFYSSRMYEKDIVKMLGISKISQCRKDKILEKYIQKYEDFLAKTKKKNYDIIKLDSTFKGKMRNKTKYNIYFAWGFYTENNIVKKECLYFHIDQKNENKKEWEKVINYLISNVNLKNTKLLISDMFNSLKTSLHDIKKYTPELKNILFQNCIWHRLHSIFNVSILPMKIKRPLFSTFYSQFKEVKDIELLKESLDLFKKMEFKKNKDINGMLNVHYEDNFNYLRVYYDLKQKGYTIKNLMQNMDIESFHADLKYYLNKTVNYTNSNILKMRIMMFLEQKQYI